MNIKKLIRQRRRKKPKFIREDYHKSHRYKIREQWRKPKGISSKVKIKKRGKRMPVEIGYKSPRAISGLHPSGVKFTMIFNLKGIKNIEKGSAVMISSTIGKRKKIEIIRQCADKGLLILNIKDTKKFLENIKQELLSRKQTRELILKNKKEKAKKKEKPKKEEKKEAKTEAEEKKELSPEEKKIDMQSKKRSLKERV